MMDIQSDIYYSEYVNESAMSSNISRLVMKAKLFIDQLIQKIKNFFAEKKINNTIAKYEKIFKNKSDTVNIDIKILMYDDIADIANTNSMYLANKLTSEYIKSCNSMINALEKLASETLKNSENK